CPPNRLRPANRPRRPPRRDGLPRPRARSPAPVAWRAPRQARNDRSSELSWGPSWEAGIHYPGRLPPRLALPGGPRPDPIGGDSGHDRPDVGGRGDHVVVPLAALPLGV